MYAGSPTPVLHPSVRRALRILWNIATLSEHARKYPDIVYGRIWKRIPPRLYSAPLVYSFGSFLHRRTCASKQRFTLNTDFTVFNTFFLRNAPHFDVLQLLMRERPNGSAVRIASIGCSSGAELYTARWVISSARPDLRITAIGVDLNHIALAKAESGLYSRHEHELMRLQEGALDRLCDGSPTALFMREGDLLRISPRLMVNNSWVLRDACDTSLAKAIGSYDVVLANNMLCHMYDSEADACMRNIATLLSPGGYLFIYGVDLDVKTRVVKSLGLQPVDDEIEETYLADWNALAHWPFTYWGREPLNKRRRDWKVRYASVYQQPASLSSRVGAPSREGPLMARRSAAGESSPPARTRTPA
jgi:Methylase of chemotaxis methyl-accepting proteins